MAEVRFFGYANVGQVGEGLHLRQRARAYFITDAAAQRNIVIVATDLWAISNHLKREVLLRLSEVIPGEVLNENFIIGCTHTHSGPGGYDENFLFNLPALGFCEENFEVIVQGIVESVLRARDNRQAGQIFVNRGDVTDVGKNRSPPAYNNNPASERAQYASDTDREMLLLKFVGDDGTEIGVIGYHGVHAVSMKLANRLVSSDNKGYAAALFEKSKLADYQLKKTFAASFPIANAGDVSPNTGSVNPETGEYYGEGADYLESTLISATRMFEGANKLYSSASERVQGPLDYRVANVDMSNVYVAAANISTVPAALGYSFTAGTADGIAFGMQYQGITEVNPLLASISKIFANYSDEFQASHGNKPILIPAGLTRPRSMVPQVLALQVLRIGQVAIIALPGEITTMAGRRLKQTVLSALQSAGVRHVGISALTDGYSQYITTKEEYDMQWYEGATTYFGPYTLMAYQQEYARLATAIATGAAVPPGPAIEERPQRELMPKHRFDEPPEGYGYGDVVTEALPSYTRGEIVTVKFAGANPRSNLKTQDTYLAVEIQSGLFWDRVADDSAWETKFLVEKASRTQTFVTVEWDIPSTAAQGTYRIRYFGDEKNRFTGRVVGFTGVSSTFTVV